MLHFRCLFSYKRTVTRIVSPLFQVYGARPIRRWLEKNVVTELSRMLVHQEIDENSTVCIDASPTDDDLVYRVEKNEGHGSAATGTRI